MPRLDRIRHRVPPVRLVVILAAALSVAFAGCKQVNTEKVESIAKDRIVERGGIAVQSVNCPDYVEAEEGAKFTCTVRGPDGSKVPFQVIQDDDEGSLTFNVSLMSQRLRDRIESLIADQIAKKYLEQVEIDCPDVVEQKRGNVFDCKATRGDGSVKTLAVTFTDDEGSFRFKEKMSQRLRDRIESLIADQIAKKYLEQVEIDCPDVVEVKRGNVFDCKATRGDGSVKTLAVTFTDDEASFRFKEKPDTES